MARIETDPNYTAPTFSRATAGTDLFKKEDVQQLAAAVSTHDHSSGKGAVLAAGAIPAGSITSGMIADGTIVAGDLADGAVTSAKILDGTIATVDIADKAVTNAKLGADTARANLLTNGGFEIWQRGNGPFNTGFARTADGPWLINLTGGGTLSVSPDTANVDVSSNACAACTVTFAGTGPQLYQSVMKTDNAGLFGKTVSCSVRVKTSTANAVRMNLTGATTVSSSYHTGDGTYQTLIATIATSVSDTAITIALEFKASCTAYIDNFMLVVGSVAADYAPLHPADDLARCLRYYEAVGGVNQGYPSVLGYATVASIVASIALGWKAIKAVTPTVTKSGTWGVNNCGQPAADRAITHGCRVYVVATGVGAFETFPADPSGLIIAESNP